MATFERSGVIDGVVVVTPAVIADERGSFVETYRRSWFPEVGEMLQANRAERHAGALVGLHFHRHQADYWTVTSGLARVVLHDLRAGSPTEGATLTLDLGSAAGAAPDLRAVLIPAGVAHGFAARSDLVVSYLVDQEYDPADELGIAWDDPEVGADWAIEAPIVSERDRTNPKRAELTADELPRYLAPGRA